MEAHLIPSISLHSHIQLCFYHLLYCIVDILSTSPDAYVLSEVASVLSRKVRFFSKRFRMKLKKNSLVLLDPQIPDTFLPAGISHETHKAALTITEVLSHVCNITPSHSCCNSDTNALKK